MLIEQHNMNTLPWNMDRNENHSCMSLWSLINLTAMGLCESTLLRSDTSGQ